MEKRVGIISKKIIAILLFIVIIAISFSNVAYAASLTATGEVKGIVKEINTEEKVKEETKKDYEDRKGIQTCKLDEELNIYGSKFNKSKFVEYIEEIEIDSKNINDYENYKVYVNQKNESLEASDCTYKTIVSNKRINEEGKLILTMDEPIKLIGEKFALAIGCPEKQEEINIVAKVRVTQTKILEGIARIGMRTLPNKSVYKKGEDLDLSGATILVRDVTGETKLISADQQDVKITGYDKNKVGIQTIKVEYQGKQTKFYVTVKEEVKEELKTQINLPAINISNETEEENETKKSEQTNNVKVVDNSNVSTPEPAKQEESKSITTAAVPSAVTRSTVVTKVEFAREPSKKVYYQGAKDLDFNGGILKITYSDGRTENWSISRTSENWKKVNYYSVDTSSLGTKTVYFSYAGKIATYRITIRKPQVTSISFVKVPTKTVYNKNETLDVTGGVLKINYENGTSENWTISRNSTKWNNINYYSGDTSKVGKQTVALVYCNKVAYYTITVKDNSPKVLAVSKMPTKTMYNVGESLNLAGGLLRITYADGRIGTISMSSSTVTKSGFNSSTPGIKIVRLTYKGLSTNISLTVKNNNQKTVKSVSISQMPAGTTVKKGAKLNLVGGTLRVVYSDGTSKIISMNASGVTKSSVDTSTVGTKIMVITYGGKSTTLKIIVQPTKITELKITRLPTKLTYNIGEKLDLTGGCIQANYDNNTGTAFSMKSAGVSTTGFNSTTPGVKTVYVMYGGKTTSFNVTVVDNRSTTVKSIAVAQIPNGTIVKKGSALNLTGGTLRVTYGDGRVSTISMKSAGVTTSYVDTSTSGTKIMTIYYKGKSTTLKIIVQSDKVVSLRINILPKKLTYNIGEKLDLSGGCIQANYSDNTATAFSMTAAGISTTGFNSTTPGVKTVYVTYGGKTTSFNVTIRGDVTIQQFNSKFTPYAGTRSGAQVRALMQAIIANNNVSKNPKVDVTLSAGTAIAKYPAGQISKAMLTIKTNSRYLVSFYYNAQGYIYEANIRTI